MIIKEFLQAIKDSEYSNESYCIYKFTFGEFGEYIGKTEKYSLRRRYRSARLSEKVKHTVKSCSVSDLKIEILYKNTDINKLREKEVEFISQLNPAIKLNIHKGGVIWDNKILRKFQNLDTGEIVEKAVCDMVRDYGSSFQNLITEKSISYKNWCLIENYDYIIEHGTGNNKRFNLQNLITGEKVFLSSAEMYKIYGGSNRSSYSALKSKLQLTVNNWCLPENYDTLIKEGWGKASKRFNFVRKIDKYKEYLTPVEMSKKYGGHRTSWGYLARGKFKSCLGWTIKS